MKKLFFAAALLCGAFQLKAQEQTEVKPVDPITASINKEIQDQTNSWKSLSAKLNASQSIAMNQKSTINKVIIGAPAIDKMPVAVLDGNSKMPIAKFNGYDPMPGSKITPDADKQIILDKINPAFKLPATLSPAPKK